MLHTAAYWLMLTLRDAIPKPQPLAIAEFTTLRLRLLKIAARITETATRVRVAFAAACAEAELFRGVARSLQLAGPSRLGRSPPDQTCLINPSAQHLRTEIAMEHAQCRATSAAQPTE